MRPSLPAAIVTLTLAIPAGAQKPADTPAPPGQTKLKDNHHEVVVSGCIKGKTLERPIVESGRERLPFDALNAVAFALEGPKELIKQIQTEHKNHYDQIAGIAIVPPSMGRADTAIAQKRIGPINIGIGGRTTTSPVQDAPQTVKLKVVSLVHVDNTCLSR